MAVSHHSRESLAALAARLDVSLSAGLTTLERVVFIIMHFFYWFPNDAELCKYSLQYRGLAGSYPALQAIVNTNELRVKVSKETVVLRRWGNKVSESL